MKPNSHRLEALVVTSIALSQLVSGPAFAAPDASDMLEKVLPGIVTIAITDVDRYKKSFGFSSPVEEIAYEGALDLSNAYGSGSGFVVERNGKKYIVTNAHVVEETPGDKPLAAYSINQTRYAVRVLGADTFYDLAILQFAGQEPGPDITSLKLRTTPLRIGEQIYAIGNPLGELPYTVTQGIVSGLNRTMPNNMGKFGYVQSSAAISPGNSGGPLVDSNGEVIGINTWARMVTKEVAYSQLNFAQNAAIAVRLIDELLAGGHLRRAYLGVELM